MMLKAAKIIYEDDVILVLDKPSGVVVNRSQTIRGTTLQDDLSDYFGLGPSLGIGDRAGIVHRLDRETSGLLVVAKTQEAFLALQAQFKAKQTEKEYLALVHGHLKEGSGTIESKIERVGKFGKFGVAKRRSISGREARTDFEVKGRYSMSESVFTGIISVQGLSLTRSRITYLKKHAREYTYLSVFPKTGRTHQIRVHLKSIGRPVVADLIYGPKKLLKFDLLWCPRLFLHASYLAFVHPKTKKRVIFESDLPKDLLLSLSRLTTDN